jgi:hypothetical protein
VTALPTFFVIGAPKAGTTSLHHYLDQHPRVQMSALKEPRYFVISGAGLSPPVEQVTDRAEYERLFDPAVEVRGESSTDYTTHPRRCGAPERIRELVPDGKFIYLVRDPVARTVSHFKMRVAAGGESRPLAAALRDFDDPTSPYIWPSLYATQLRRYLQLFPPERFLVVDQADLLSDREATLAEVFGFLGVERELDPSLFEAELHEGHEVRAYPSFYAQTMNRVLGPRVRWVPAGLRRGTRRAVERRLWPPRDVSVDDRLRRRLENVYAPEVARLRELTGKAFPTWSV